MENFNLLLEKYASLIAEVGLGVKQGHVVSINSSVEQVELTRLVVQKCYQLGAKEVGVIWSDEIVAKELLLHADEDVLSTVTKTSLTLQDELLEKKAARLSIVSSNPNSLKGVPSERINLFQTAQGKARRPLSAAIQSNQVSWSVVCAASPGWAKIVFPSLPEDEAVEALWDAIFKSTRIYDENPIQSWMEHDQKLAKKADFLNEQQFDRLHYTAPGCDIVFGMPENHHWEGAGSKNERGDSFMANMPTEEVFAAPDAKRVDGIIQSTRPLSYAGTIIDGMKFTFKDGKVVDFSAEKGEDVLRDLLNTDEGSQRLGEIALVPDPSPISQSGITFFNTLFDENASNHLAFGSAYAFSLEGGESMSEEELKQGGLNRSNVHVDFMVGGPKMDIDGIKKDGTIIPIFRNGDWAF
ncbi:MAG: aminopeptidase [Streptococcaceae bacterium]|jgi:aminopeptidase|nr:aminopeptidase [Streptococcaceae bacterium]